MSHWTVLTSSFLCLCVCGMFLLYGYGLLYPNNESLVRRFCHQRMDLMFAERSTFIGAELAISENMREDTVNVLMQQYKQADLHNFLPDRNFLKVRRDIERSHLHELIRAMPKGGALRVHDLGMSSCRPLLQFTYMPHLWVCVVPTNGRFEKMVFALKAPANVGPLDAMPRHCVWQLMERMRMELGADVVDKALLRRMTIDEETHEQLADAMAVQAYVDDVAQFIRGLVTYYPIWGEYIRKSIEQFHNDGLQYMEIRTSFPELYNIDGSRYDNLETAKIMYQQSVDYVTHHLDFVGVRVIYEPSADFDGHQFQEHASTYSVLKCALGDFLIGFGWSTLNESAHHIAPFAEHIIDQRPLMDFYFTVGKTSSLFGDHDVNVGDALLLGAKRIGNGYILAKHIAFRKYGKKADIPVEVSPISDQMFHMVTDLRNHAASHLLIYKYPMVIGSDYPGLWDADPASHDFYMIYMGMANAWDDLAFLKQMALNSLKYSGLSKTYRELALLKFENKWSQWVMNISS